LERSWNDLEVTRISNETISSSDGLNEWEKPIPLGEEAPEEIDPQWFPPVIRNFAESIKDSLQISPDMVYMAMLGCLALCNAKKYEVECRKDWAEPLNLFIVLVNDPGTRKSALLKIVTGPIIDHEQLINDAEKRIIAQNRSEKRILEQQIESLEKAAKGGNTDRDLLNAKIQERSDFKEIRETQYIADNATVESITSLLCEQNGRLGVFSAEGGLFDIMAGQYGKMESFDTILQAHTGEDIRVSRKGRPSEHIKHPALTILLGIQPSVLEDALSRKKFNGKGLIARFLFIMCKRDINDYDFYTPAISSEARWEYIKLITTLLDNPLAEEPTTIYFSKEAEVEFAEFYKEIKTRKKTDLERILFFSEKLNGATARIAANLHIAEHPENPQDHKISGETMRNAIAIARYLISHCKNAIDSANADPLKSDCKYAIKKLREKGKATTISKREILRVCRKFQKAKELDPVLDELENLGYLELIEDEKATGRPSTMYNINPWLFEEERN
jgi:hypothetical protein